MTRNLLLLICLCAFKPRGAAADGLDAAVLAHLQEATVFIRVSSLLGQLQGSGFYIGRNVVVTNAHVLGLKDDPSNLPTAISVVVGSGRPGKENACAGKLITFDAGHDLAYLRVETACSAPLTFAPSASIVETCPVFICGFPFGEQLASPGANPGLTVGSGSVAALRSGAVGPFATIRINGDLHPGDSGGPIVLSSGDLVAVSVAAMNGAHVGFAIPGDSLREQLTGRIVSLGFTGAARAADGTYAVDVTAATLDPLDRLRSLTVDYWPGRPDDLRPEDPKTRLPTHGAPNDGPLQHLILKKDAATGNWVGSIKHLALPEGRELIHRPTWVDAEGQQVGAAVAYDHLRADVAGQGASGRAATPAARPTPVPVTPTGVEPLAATEERDDRGGACLHVSAKEREITVGDGIIQLTTTPTGRDVFAIFTGKAAVVVLDPESLKPLGEIPTPPSPVMMWSDDTRIVVACGEAQVVCIIDAEKRKPIASVAVAGNPELQPIGVVGRAPDGSYMTLWQERQGSLDDIHLYQVSEAGQARFIAHGPFEWCLYALNAQTLLCQHGFTHSTSGAPELYPLVGVDRVAPASAYRELRQTVEWDNSFAHCFPTFDRACVVLPTTSTGRNPKAGVRVEARTWLATTDLQHVLAGFPGAALAEVPSRNMFVSWDVTGTAPGSYARAFYASRSTGRVFRIIDIELADRLPSVTTISRIPPAIYVPGHELILRRTNGGERAILMSRCGPVDRSAADQADPLMRPTNVPPAAGKAGAAVSYVPRIAATGAPTAVFKLKRTLDGMRIDPATGAWSWTPSEAYLGRYRVEIVATVDATEIPVIAWTITIE